MIPIIAWRNIWRNRTRSLVIIASVTLGLWAGVFVTALSFGMTEERKHQMINEQISHIQVHNPAFIDKQEIGQFIPHGPAVLDSIAKKPLIHAISGRSLINAMLTAPQGGNGVRIIGLYPEMEANLTGLNTKVIEGEYFPDQKNRILVGKALADKLGLKLGSKVVLTFQDTSTEIISGMFRIGGLYKTINAKLDESLVYVSNEDLARLMGTEPLIHEIALLVQDDNQVNTVQSDLESTNPALTVRNWKQLSPELEYLDEMMDVFLYIFMGIILFALGFGLVNTMLMAVLERVRELGMMMAIGLTKTKLFFMVVLETAYLSLTGAAVGLILGGLTVYFTGRSGISIEVVQQGMEEFGMGSQLYPSLSWHYYPIIAGMVIVFSVLAAIYPAIKALRLNPTEAIRKI